MDATSHELLETEIHAYLKAGNLRQAYELLAREYYEAVFTYANHILGEPDVAQDVTQETFAAAGETLENFRSDAKDRTWLFEIVRKLRARSFRYRHQKELKKENMQLVVKEIHRDSRSTPESLLSKQEKDRYTAIANIAVYSDETSITGRDVDKTAIWRKNKISLDYPGHRM